jgi:NADPH:quinone reductase
MRPVARSQPARARGRFVGGADDACDFVDRGRGIVNDIDDVRVGGTPSTTYDGNGTGLATFLITFVWQVKETRSVVVRAAVVTELNGPDGVVIREVPDPTLKPGHVLIDVEYAGISFPDVLQTRGQYQVRPELPFTPGWEISGVVREGSGSFRAGDRVAAMPFTGGVAESVVVDANYVFPLPDSVSFATAAALPLNYLTAHFALVRRAKLQPGETVLVQGAAGGVGSASCNMAAALGARVVAVVSSTEKVAIAEAAGAHHVVLADGFAAEVRQLTDGRGVDVIVDPVGGERFTDSLRSLAREGRLLVVGFAGGEIPVVKTNRLLLTNTTVMGAATRELWNQEPEMPRRQWNELMPLLKSGVLRPVIGPQFSIQGTGSAIRTIDERRAAGKVLVRIR